MKNKYYSIKNIRAKNAHYNVIFGERSNGKTYAVDCDVILDNFVKSGFVEQGAIIRRYDDDFIGATSARSMFNALMQNGEGKNVIKERTKIYDGVEYYGGAFYMTIRDEKTGLLKRTNVIIAWAFALTSTETYKGGSYPNITTVLFDEFMTRRFYLTDEFILFQDILSTIIRDRNNITIYMCANTVNKYGCPYFKEMGLYRIKDMQQGDIDVYTYGDSGLTVAVEWSDSPSKTGKASDVYFAFNNPRLKMITNGVWEMDIYPHCPSRYRPKDVAFTYFIRYEDQLLQCDIVITEKDDFTYIHQKTGDIKYPDDDLIFDLTPTAKPNMRTRITTPFDNLGKRIYAYYGRDKVFYQDNETGEIVRNYLNACKHIA